MKVDMISNCDEWNIVYVSEVVEFDFFFNEELGNELSILSDVVCCDDNFFNMRWILGYIKFFEVDVII